MITTLVDLSWQDQTALALILVAALGFVVFMRRGGKFDKRFTSLVMLGGLAWSAEAMYEIATKTFGIETEAALIFCAVFEAALWIVMRRAEKTMEDFGWPGKAGRTVWFMAVGMGVVAASNAHSVDHPDTWAAGPAVFRLAIPLVVTVLWWGGLVGEGAKPEGEESTWLFTPSKILVRLGIKAPGKSDVASVQRDWLADRMTKLEFARRFGPEGKREKAKEKIAKLALDADSEIISVVLNRVSLADSFLSGDPSRVVLQDVPTVVLAPVPAVPATAKDTVPADVPAAQDDSPPTEDELMHAVMSLAVQIDERTGRLYSVRAIGDMLGINKNKVTELKRRAKDKLDNEITDLTPGFFDYQKTTPNGHHPELEEAR